MRRQGPVINSTIRWLVQYAKMENLLHVKNLLHERYLSWFLSDVTLPASYVHHLDVFPGKSVMQRSPSGLDFREKNKVSLIGSFRISNPRFKKLKLLQQIKINK